MAELFERLEKAGTLLSSAIDQYLDVCIAIRGYPRLSFAGVSRAFFDRVTSELLLVSSYETKIKQAKAAIGYTINTSPTTHINSLPPEILTRIFYLATNTCGLKYDLGDSVPIPRYPDFLSHVCARWRQVALDSPRLWTHIDLVRLSAANHGFKPRAETFTSRAGNCLLDMHIYEQADCHAYDHQSMLDVVTLTAPKARSLDLAARYIPGFGQRPRLLDYFFDNCIPNIFTKLSLTELFDPSDDGTQRTHFIDSHDRSIQTLAWPPPLNVSAERLDALLLPVTHLKLDGIYFPWAHQAYHGLVELRLHVHDECTALISTLELAGVLAASPRLKLFHSEINVLDDPSLGSIKSPVRLDDLEVLKLHSLDDENPHVIFGLLTTGPKPLRVSFAYGEHADMSDPEQRWLIQIKDFFKRSNITELRLRYAIWPPQVGPENLLESLPNLRVLILEACTDDSYSYSYSSPFPPIDSEPLHLDVMYMVDCTIEIGKLARTLKHLRAELVVFWRCDFPKDGNGLQYRTDHEEIKAELDVICPSFAWIDRNKPNPIKHWDEFGCAVPWPERTCIP